MESGWIAAMVVLALFAGYLISSLFFLKFPLLLHKKKKLAFVPKHISHRGGAAENLENTMTAFKHAVSLGSQMLELDCHLTKDGQVVVSHDVTLKRTCDAEVAIADTNYDDLPMLKSCLGLDFNSYHQVTGEDRKMPLLKEVFAAFPDMPINVDVKVNDDQLIAEVNSLIQAFNREHMTAWGNHSAAVVEKLYQANPNIPLIFSLRRVAVLVVLFYTGLLPFVPIKESLLEVIMPSIVLDKRNFKTEYSTIQTILFKIMDVLLMRPALIHHLNRRGIQTYMWVLNSEEEFERAFRLGATGVMTDFPTMLKDYLDTSQPGWR
ncbi:lysophospholipase D GDPD1-like [Babylonia areolata]|uniref:lysophospholipase D GDPD1-like n=1 Tax=Babylonia areolata TaxID=304850 RepID=UPI003FD00901